MVTLIFQSTVDTFQTEVDAVKTAQTATDNKVAALEGTVTGLSTAMVAQVRHFLNIIGFLPPNL